jgi:taurine dioxygenase
MALEARVLSPGFGAEIRGFDGSRPLSPHDEDELRRLLDEHQLLCFRGQPIDVETQLRLLRVFGPLCDERGNGRYYSHVSNVEPDGFPQGRQPFHQEYSFTPWPHWVVSLCATELVGDCPPTLFTSNVVGYARLSDTQRAQFSDLEAVHTTFLHPDQPPAELTRTRLPELSGDAPSSLYPRTVQPVIKKHPRNQTPMLFITELFTSHVSGLDPDESERVIQEAYALLYASDYIYEHPWRLDDLIIWDNQALQHSRVAVPDGVRRTLRRVVVNDKTLEDIYSSVGAARKTRYVYGKAAER